MKRDNFPPPLDPVYVRSQYDQALGYVQFVKRRIKAALRDVYGANNFPALAATHLANVSDLYNDWAQAKYTFARAYLLLCDVMEWDDDDAKAAGIESEVKL